MFPDFLAYFFTVFFFKSFSPLSGSRRENECGSVLIRIQSPGCDLAAWALSWLCFRWSWKGWQLPDPRIVSLRGMEPRYTYVHPFTAVGRWSKNLYLLALATGRQQLRCRFRYVFRLSRAKVGFVNVQFNEDSWVTSLLHCIKILILCSWNYC